MYPKTVEEKKVVYVRKALLVAMLVYSCVGGTIYYICSSVM